MKSHLTYLLLVVLFGCGILVYRFITYPYRLTSHDFKSLYERGDAATREEYIMQSKAEFDSSLAFPLGNVSKALFCRGFFSVDKNLNAEQSKRLISILNDTASYVWGEVGTFISDRVIVFYDKNNNPLGITELEEDGGHQSHSHPYLRRTKWGYLTDKALKEIDRLTTESNQ